MTRARRRIAVLFHERDRLHPRLLRTYVVFHLAKYWRAAGYEVEYLFGTGERVPADLVFVHVDLSVVPDAYLKFAATYPVAVNGRVRDIRKSTFSEHVVQPGDGWDGPVIVKSDLNSAGRPERRLRQPTWLERHPLAQRGARWLARLRGGAPEFDETRDYHIYDHAGAVPRRWFGDRRIVVERFLPEIEDGLYRVRIYQFLGDRSTCTRLGSRERLVHGATLVCTEDVEPHPSILDWRRRLSLDYGKLDYVEIDGEALLLDVNKTTGAPASFSERPEFEAMRRERAAGIDSFFD